MDSISVQDLSPKLKEQGKRTILIDVREPEEFSRARIPEAVNVPLKRIPTATDVLKNYSRIYVHCASGGRSALACDLLQSVGVPAINVEGGISAWKEAGLPVIEDQ